VMQWTPALSKPRLSILDWVHFTTTITQPS